MKARTYPVPVPALFLAIVVMWAIVRMASAQSTICVPPPAGLVGWWAAEGNENDSAGTNAGSLVGSATFALGEVGQAFSFDGNGSYVNIPRSPSLDAGAQITVEFWMNIDPSNPANACCQGLVSSDFYSVSISSGLQAITGVNFSVSVNNGGFFYQISEANDGGAVLSPGQWHHIAATYDGAKIQLYVDGAAWGNPTFLSGHISPMLTNSFVSIGSEDGRTSCPNCMGRYFNGLIDEVSLYKRALSAAEIAAIYNAGSAGKCAGPAIPFFYSGPTDQTVSAGANVSFTADVGGTQPLGYQWQWNGTNIAGATNLSLTLSNVQAAAAGNYSLFVTNSVGAASNSAALTINPAPPCAVAPSNLVGWWRAEGNVLDEIGGDNGSLQNGATIAPGKVGSAFSFNGTNQFVKIPKSPYLDVGAEVTVEFWMNIDPGNPADACCQGLVCSDFYSVGISQ